MGLRHRRVRRAATLYPAGLRDRRASDGVGNGGDVYLEVGINPSFTLIEGHDITVNVPLTAGFSIDDYYEFDTNGDLLPDDEFFDFVDLGLELSMPAPLIPETIGAWTMTVGVPLLVLGDPTEAANSTPDDTEIIGKFGMIAGF